MTLRSDGSYWLSLGAPAIEAPPLMGNETCEIAILGGGITGALLADRLTSEGVDVVLVDKRELGVGSTAASTGLLQYEVDTPLVELISRVGEGHAVHAYQRGLRAIDEIERLTVELGDPCGFVRRDTLYFASRRWHYRGLQNEYECRRAHGFDVDFLEREALAEISSISAVAAIRSHGDAEIDPLRFTRRLLRRAQAHGLRVFSQTEIAAIQEETRRVVLHAANGSITARRIVYATGYDSHRYLKTDVGSLHCTFAVASEPMEPISGWPNSMLIWETARPYFYARQTRDGRAIIGGMDTPYSTDHKRDGLIRRQAARLERRFRWLFPAAHFVPAVAWAGTFGESKDGLAYIGQPADRPNAYFAVGYGGNGITFSVVAARLIADLYQGRENADAAVFRFGR